MTEEKWWTEEELDSHVKSLFKDHIATYAEHGPVKEIVWARPNDGFEKIRYLQHGDFLYVSGDLGATTFQRHHMSFNFLALSHFGYISEKIVACSEYAVRKLGYVWSPQKAAKYVRTVIWNFYRSNPTEVKAFLKDLRDYLLLSCETEHEFIQSLYERQEDIEVMGDSWYEIIPPECGCKPSNRVLLQKHGLKMALEQLKENGITTT